MAEDADVIVVGGGLAGLVAATEIADAGKRVIVIDQEAHRLYAADRTTNGVDVFDITTKEAKYLKTVDAGSPSAASAAIVGTRPLVT